ncbi:ArsR/SmtB family transcription factor [Thalassotalea sediminis]|uniref:ArsR/SmtB family transcription factor n=1 Tax=Thalassotalea sediminis TaxID=1759089 RepID=UPI0025746F92|nr:metalloregulator ArsR/SmtB family transcription factor [Thalassotalea sediminis]
MNVVNFEEKAKEASSLLKMMGNEVRLQILCSLVDQKLTVGEINGLIDISQSALSQHLAKLRTDGLVETERDGLNIYYRVCRPIVVDILRVLQSEFCPPE